MIHNWLRLVLTLLSFLSVLTALLFHFVSVSFMFIQFSHLALWSSSFSTTRQPGLHIPLMLYTLYCMLLWWKHAKINWVCEQPAVSIPPFTKKDTYMRKDYLPLHHSHHHHPRHPTWANLHRGHWPGAAGLILLLHQQGHHLHLQLPRSYRTVIVKIKQLITTAAISTICLLFITLFILKYSLIS